MTDIPSFFSARDLYDLSFSIFYITAVQALLELPALGESQDSNKTVFSALALFAW